MNLKILVYKKKDAFVLSDGYASDYNTFFMLTFI